MSAVGDFADLDNNDTSVTNVRQSTRPKTLTEKGLSFESEKTLKSARDLARKILKLCEKINKLSSSEDYDKVEEAVINLNEAHDEYERVLSRADHLGSAIPQNEAQDVILAVTTAKLDAMKVTSSSKRSTEPSDKTESQSQIEMESNCSVKSVENVIASEDSFMEKQVKVEKSRDTLPPEKWVQNLDKRLQIQLELLNQSVLSDDNILIQSELRKLECLMKDISEEKAQISATLDAQENGLFNNWFDQVNTVVSNKKSMINTYLSSLPNSDCTTKNDISLSTQSSASILSVIKRDTANSGVQEEKVITETKQMPSIRSSGKSETSARSNKSTSEKNVSKWLENLDDKHSLHGSCRSVIKRQSGSKSDVLSNIGSDDRRLVESVKGSMERIHKKLLMQLNLIDSALTTEDVELVRTETANLDLIFAELNESSASYEDIIRGSEKQAHTVWMNEVDANVFKKKQDVCSWLINHNECASRKSSRSSRKSSSKSSSKSSKSSHSKSSKTSSSSSASGKSAIQQKAITAGLQAEVDILKETMARSIEIEAKKKEDEIKSRIEKIEVQLARSKAMESVYGGSRNSCSNIHEQSHENIGKVSDKGHW